jgi:two-component system chemotaxis sensor kinase CheA
LEKGFSNESILELFIYETTQNIEQLEKAILTNEKASCFTPDMVNEIFRIMHTIKGSSAMMMYDNISLISHSMEDLFYFIREESPENMDCTDLTDIVLECVDFIKLEMNKVKNADNLDGDPSNLTESIRKLLISLKGEEKSTFVPKAKEETPVILQYDLSAGKNGDASDQKCYEAVIYFEDGCEMENIRAFTIIHNLKDIVEDFSFYPGDILENINSIQVIREQGFRITLRSNRSMRELHEFLNSTAFIRNLELTELLDRQLQDLVNVPQNTAVQECPIKISKLQDLDQVVNGQSESRNSHQSIISVDVVKLDKLMDLMGEMVIAEAMVTENPELKMIQLNSFYKAARQLKKITNEMQDMVMSIRMVPLSATFNKMHRIVRDMKRKLGKEVELTLIGESTEVDKNIIEHISDPLMHLVRNAVDHGIETAEVRIANSKPSTGQVTIEAKNAGSEVYITVRDDGEGLNKEKILKKAKDNGLISKSDEMTDREIYNLIVQPGFSTNDNVTEFSGRGVGMDVVTKNLEAVGGSVSIDSTEGVGTITTLKIPLTLAIIDGMNIRVGNAKYTIPITSIQEAFKTKRKDIVKDPEGNEMIMVRGECYPILRLHELYNIKTDITDLTEGIILMVEQDGKYLCILLDELLGQQQVVVKSLPNYIKDTKRIEGLAGCTLLGDGSISLILHIGGLFNIKP